MWIHEIPECRRSDRLKNSFTFAFRNDFPRSGVHTFLTSRSLCREVLLARPLYNQLAQLCPVYLSGFYEQRGHCFVAVDKFRQITLKDILVGRFNRGARITGSRLMTKRKRRERGKVDGQLAAGLTPGVWSPVAEFSVHICLTVKLGAGFDAQKIHVRVICYPKEQVTSWLSEPVAYRYRRAS